MNFFTQNKKRYPKLIGYLFYYTFFLKHIFINFLIDHGRLFFWQKEKENKELLKGQSSK